MELPYFQQETKDTCAAASLRMALASIGINRSEKVLASLLKTNRKSGVRVEAFAPVAEKYKLRYVVGRNATLADLEEILDREYRVIVGYRHPGKDGHYSLVSKLTDKHIYLNDPNPYAGRNNRYSRDYFNRLWRRGLKYDKDKTWFIGLKK